MDFITLIFALAFIKGLPDTSATQASASATAAETAAAQASAYAIAAGNAAERAAQYDSPLYLDELPGTTQEITFASDGSLQSIVHKQGNTVLRTDTFTFGDNTVTETRTLSTGETLTIATNLNTLKTTVTYTVQS